MFNQITTSRRRIILETSRSSRKRDLRFHSWSPFLCYREITFLDVSKDIATRYAFWGWVVSLGDVVEHSHLREVPWYRMNSACKAMSKSISEKWTVKLSLSLRKAFSVMFCFRLKYRDLLPTHSLSVSWVFVQWSSSTLHVTWRKW